MDIKITFDSLILLNEIMCKHCGDHLRSETVHDFKMCSCGKCGVDGGLEYLRRIGEPEDYIELAAITKTANNQKEDTSWKKD